MFRVEASEIKHCECGAVYLSRVCPRCGGTDSQAMAGPGSGSRTLIEVKGNPPTPSSPRKPDERRQRREQEHEEQVALFERAGLMSFKYSELHLLFAIPNGGQRSKAVAGKLKTEGVKSGVPDVFLPVPRAGYHGLWIEMKSETGRLSDAQKEWKASLEGQGYRWEMCRSADEAWTVVMGYLGLAQEKESKKWGVTIYDGGYENRAHEKCVQDLTDQKSAMGDSSC